MNNTMQGIITGEVVHGNRIGHQLGFPTANLALSDRDDTPNGVYAVRVSVGGIRYGGVANIGSSPTVTDRPQRFLEVYIFGFEGDLYGKTIAVEPVAYLRPETKFASLDALKEQIEKDKTASQNIPEYDERPEPSL